MILNQKSRFRLDIMKKFFTTRVRHWIRSSRAAVDSPNPVNIKGQFRQSFEKSDLVEDIADYCRGFGLGDLQRSIPKLFFSLNRILILLWIKQYGTLPIFLI